MKQVRIGNDIKFVIPLNMTVESGNAVKWHVYVCEAEPKKPEIPSGIQMLNGRPELHHHHRHADMVELKVTSATNYAVNAVWAADLQKLGVYDLVIYAETDSGSKGAVDVQRLVQICKHTPSEKNDSGTEIDVETIVKIDPMTIEFAGMSAYELAVSKGFVGTMEEWLLSLKGADGHDGQTPVITATKQGKVTSVLCNGRKIAEVRDGDDGKTPIIFASKSGMVTSVYCNGVKIASIMDGAKGERGERGEKGDDGADGQTPMITSIREGKKTTIYADGRKVADILDGDDAKRPTEGWQKEDLAEGVQYVLERAVVVEEGVADIGEGNQIQFGKAQFSYNPILGWTMAAIGKDGESIGMFLNNKFLILMNDIDIKRGLYENKGLFERVSDLEQGGGSKPEGGWQKTDLAESVQTSISRADAIYEDYINSQNLL